MGQRDVICTFRLAQRAAYRTAISAAQTCYIIQLPALFNLNIFPEIVLISAVCSAVR